MNADTLGVLSCPTTGLHRAEQVLQIQVILQAEWVTHPAAPTTGVPLEDHRIKGTFELSNV